MLTTLKYFFSKILKFYHWQSSLWKRSHLDIFSPRHMFRVAKFPSGNPSVTQWHLPKPNIKFPQAKAETAAVCWPLSSTRERSVSYMVLWYAPGSVNTRKLACPFKISPNSWLDTRDVNAAIQNSVMWKVVVNEFPVNNDEKQRKQKSGEFQTMGFLMYEFIGIYINKLNTHEGLAKS